MRTSNTLLLLLVFPLFMFAQKGGGQPDITGLWTGSIYNDSTHQYHKYEVGISREKGKFIGFSHTRFVIHGKEYFGVKKLNINRAADGKIIIKDEELVADNYQGLPAQFIQQLNVLTFNEKDSIPSLAGVFATRRTKEYRAVTGSVVLRRKNEFWQAAIWPHLLGLDKEKNFAFIKDYTPPAFSSVPGRGFSHLEKEEAGEK